MPRARPAALLAALVWIAPAGAETLSEPPPGTVGLLSVAELTGADGDPCAAFTPGSLALHDAPDEAPDDGARLLGLRPQTLPDGGCRPLAPQWLAGGEAGREIPLMEHGYETVSLIVLDTRAPWYRIALPEGSAWLRADHGHYRDLVDLYADGLTYLTTAWDGELCDGPDPEAACARADAQRLHREALDAVTVLTWAQMPDGLWLEVELITSPCSTDVQRRLPIRGWLRAHGRDRRPTVWFHPRGC